jgi:hypothetical protein
MWRVMMRRADQRPAAPRLTPEGTFVIQLRSNSNVQRGRLRGRIEHVMSGQSVQFTSLESLLAFMARCTPAQSQTAGKDKEDPS